MSEEPDFISVIRGAVEADPTNVGLRLDLVELLLNSDPTAAARELEVAATLGAPGQQVLLLRARLAAAQLRGTHRTATPEAGAVSPAETALGAPAPEQASPQHQPARRAVPAPSPDDDGDVPLWEAENVDMTLADVAGLAEVKAHLEASFLAPMRNPALAAMFGKRPGGSLLMYGPPGCGKTFIARAVAGELGASFIHATVADIASKWMGEAERAIRSLFEAARAASPCVIFFDEFDALGGRRSSGSAGAQSLRMMVAQLLEELDGVRSSNDGIYVLAATNRPWDIDTALRRPGRLDRTVLILPPDEAARIGVVRHELKGKLTGTVDEAAVAARTAEFSGADLAYVIRTAVEQAFMQSLREGAPRSINTQDLLAAASGITPSTRTWFEQVKPALEYGVDDGTHGQLRAYLKRHRI